MAEMKKITPDKILWLDLEMTGLNAQKDRIVEVGAIVTDWRFNELETFESGVGNDPKAIKSLLDANDWYNDYPDNKAELLANVAKSPPEAEVEAKLLDLINRYLPHDVPALLGGNSIHMDRQFIRQWWPKLDARLHYRMLDVSAWKVVMIGRYGIEFPKKESHRALDDIRESIAELELYLGKMQIDAKI